MVGVTRALRHTTDSDKPRLDWPDIARGLSIVGVVVLHACLIVPGGMQTKIAVVNEFFGPLRMPLFFLVSGYFSIKVLNYNFGQLFRRRLWFLLVPLVVWTPLELKLRFWIWETYLGDPPHPPSMYLKFMVEGATMYWFLNCLVLFSFFLWLTAKLPRWAAFALSFTPMLLLLRAQISILEHNVMLYLPIFMIGATMRKPINHLVKNSTNYKYIGTALGAFLVGNFWLLYHYHSQGKDVVLPVVGWLLDAGDINSIIQFSVRILMLPSAILLAVFLAKIPLLNTALLTLGRNTLVIYIGHAFGISLLFEIVLFGAGKPFYPDAPNFFGSSTFGIILCIACSALSSLLFYCLSKIPVAGWLIFPPPLPELAAMRTSAAVKPKLENQKTSN